MLRRLHHEQPASFAFTPANQAWAEAQITKYPAGRQASAIIPLLWRAQEQEGWLTRPAIEHVADMLGMAYIRALEVATFYFMFQLAPVGSVAHVQICGTLSCMICGAEDLIAVCKKKIASKPHTLSADGKFSWEEVECLGACANAPMTQIGKDYYEDLTAEKLEAILDDMAAGKVPVPGPQNGRYAAEPLSGLTSLKDLESGKQQYNASVQAAVDIGDTLKRIDGTEVPLVVSWAPKAAKAGGSAAVTAAVAKAKAAKAAPKAKAAPVAEKPAAKAEPVVAAAASADAQRPAALSAARGGKADDLKQIKGVGPKLEALCNALGIYHFDQIAAWTATEVEWMDHNLEGFRGRVTRDTWVEQAKTLAAGGATEFSKRVEQGKVY
ncbi:MAG: NADH-quinone oxidoreductase subunit E [Paracoccaceae bacterium]|nr:NADH-quinone oxidoreductase subunit E [Paracoccaceae bacterium]